MNFGEQFKKIRTEMKLTQEQVATQLNVSRQAISNWENNKNLPDIEMIVTISEVFHLSLDQLILGGDTAPNNMTEKLIHDGSEVRRAQLDMITVCVGASLLIMGIGCILIKAFSVEYIDANGYLHENFFLLPIGFLLIFCGHIAFWVAGIRKVIQSLKERFLKSKDNADKKPANS